MNLRESIYILLSIGYINTKAQSRRSIEVWQFPLYYTVQHQLLGPLISCPIRLKASIPSFRIHNPERKRQRKRQKVSCRQTTIVTNERHERKQLSCPTSILGQCFSFPGIHQTDLRKYWLEISDTVFHSMRWVVQRAVVQGTENAEHADP